MYTVGGGANTLCRLAAAGLVVATGDGAASAGLSGVAWVVTLVTETERAVLAAYPELSEFMVFWRVRDGAALDAVAESPSAAGMAPACSCR
jgi:hypothetical protein